MPQNKNMISGAAAIMVMANDGQIDVQGQIDTLVREMNATNLAAPNDEIIKYKRNELQSRIVMVSNQKCGLYLREIAAANSQSNMAWGSFSLLFSGAASVNPHAQTAKAFAAASTVATGANALYEQAYFNNLAVNVIAAGIAMAREAKPLFKIGKAADIKARSLGIAHRFDPTRSIGLRADSAHAVYDLESILTKNFNRWGVCNNPFKA